MNTTKFENGKFFYNFHSFLFCAGHVLVIAIPSEKKAQSFHELQSKRL
jgi:hypothetical protein